MLCTIHDSPGGLSQHALETPNRSSHSSMKILLIITSEYGQVGCGSDDFQMLSIWKTRRMRPHLGKYKGSVLHKKHQIGYAVNPNDFEEKYLANGVNKEDDNWVPELHAYTLTCSARMVEL